MDVLSLHAQELHDLILHVLQTRQGRIYLGERGRVNIPEDVFLKMVKSD